MEHTEDDFTTLGQKLDALDLTAGERTVLHGLLAKASPDQDVTAFRFEPGQRTSDYMLGLNLGIVVVDLERIAVEPTTWAKRP